MIIDIYGKPYRLNAGETAKAKKMCTKILNTVKTELPMDKYPTFFPTFLIVMHTITGNLINNMNLDGFEEALRMLNMTEEENGKIKKPI